MNLKVLETIETGNDLMDLEPFKKLISEKSDLAFKPDAFINLKDALKERFAMTSSPGPLHYLEHLYRDDQEINHLINLLTINETYFLRESKHYELLTKTLLPPLLARRRGQGRKVKILSAGCASGEEPYSVLIALIQCFGENILNDVEVQGMDIDSDAIQKAHLGVYSKHSFRQISPGMREHYFSEFIGNRYVLKDSLISQVKFHVHNLVDPGYPDDITSCDIIFYRNVSIYYEPDTRIKIMENLARLLTDPGYVLMGSVETSQHNRGILKLCEVDGVFLFENSSRQTLSIIPKVNIPTHPKKETQPARPQPTPTPRKKIPDTPPARSPIMAESFSKAMEEAHAGKPKEALDYIRPLLEKPTPPLEALTLHAGLMLQLNNAEEAQNICKQILDRDEWNPEAYLYLGLAHQKKGEHEAALELFKKALYLDASPWVVHFHLAELYNLLGHKREAVREYRLTLTQLENNGVHNHGLTFLPENVQETDLIAWCRNRQETLNSNTA